MSASAWTPVPTTRHAAIARGRHCDATLARLVRRVRLRLRLRAAWLEHIWSHEGLPGGEVVVTPAEVETHLEGRDSPEAQAAWLASTGDERVRGWAAELDAVEAKLEKEEKSPLYRLCALFGLSGTEIDLLHACVAERFDSALSRAFAYVQDHVRRDYVTEVLAERLFEHPPGSIWRADSPLRRWKLVHELETPPDEPNRLVCDPIVLGWLQEEEILDDVLVGIVEPTPPQTPLEAWPVAETVRFVESATRGGQPVRICLAGPPGSGRRSLAATIADRLGRGLLTIDTSAASDGDWAGLFVRGRRQARLRNAAVAWAGQPALERRWPREVDPEPVEFAICLPGEEPPLDGGLVQRMLGTREPSIEERKRLWRQHLPATAAWPEAELDALSSRYRATVGAIAAVGRGGATSTEAAAEHLRAISRDRLGDLAEHVECPFRRDDLVVGEAVGRALDDLVYEASARSRFWESAEARRLFPRGRGLLALLVGPPGVGKTMCAQVIASELSFDLHRVNLASVVSKWVGDTPKHLRRILCEAAGMNVVLLFDEADALFAKRTDIVDAQARFAAIDTNFLLQAVESYEGVALLATSRPASIDSAFVRRLRYVLDFGVKPDVAQRFEVWGRILRELVGEPDRSLERGLKLLAEGVATTPAQIKFAVLSAVFAARGGSVGLPELLRGLENELNKEGRSISPREWERLMSHGL